MSKQLPLFNDAHYSYRTAIDGLTHQLEFLWSDRSQAWFLTLLKETGEPIFEGVKVVEDYPLLNNYVKPFSGFFFLTKKEGSTLAVGRDVDKTHSFYYVN